MSIGFTGADESQPLVERQCPLVDIQHTEAHWQAHPTPLVHDERHALAADALALMLWQEE